MKNFNKLCTICALSLIGLSTANKLSAQVSIGSDTEPLKGILLDFNQKSDKTNDGGLGLPRVLLTDINKIEPICQNEQKKREQHTGLMVYHVGSTTNTCLTEGIYVWGGESWTPVLSYQVRSHEDQEGNTFYSNQFGDAGTWMVTNLRAKKYAIKQGGANIDGPMLAPGRFPQREYKTYAHPSSYVSEGGSAGSDEDYKENTNLGLLYSWHAATNNANGAGNEKVQGICPDGWHLPSKAEWEKLAKELTGTNQKKYIATGTTVGAGAYGIAARDVCETPTTGAMRGLSKPFNQGGFAALLAGCAVEEENDEFGVTAYFWLSDYAVRQQAAVLKLSNGSNSYTINYPSLPATSSSSYDQDMYSVRCVKD